MSIGGGRSEGLAAGVAAAAAMLRGGGDGGDSWGDSARKAQPSFFEVRATVCDVIDSTARSKKRYATMSDKG